MKNLYKAVAIIVFIGGLSSCGTQPSLPPTTTTTPSYTPEILSAQRLPTGTAAHISGNVSFTATTFSALPSWDKQSFSGSLKAFVQGCERLQAHPAWTEICSIAKRTPLYEKYARAFFENNFTPWTIAQNGNLAGKVTGYYEPAINGSLSYSSAYRFPIYEIPQDFIVVPYTGGAKSGSLKINIIGANKGEVAKNGAYSANLADFPVNERTRSLKGRTVGNRFVPYYTRAQINAGALNNQAKIIAYAADPVELFFMHVQGSGRLRLPDGSMLPLAYADKNDHPYVSIGRYMANKGYLPLAQANAEGIKNWLAAHPDKLAEVLGQNPGYVFFKRGESGVSGPTGALGVPLSPGFSAAVDKHIIELGSPIFVATTDPRNRRALNRLMMAHDTGSAIVGAVRVDVFWGYGDTAGNHAGKMNEVGYLWNLLPNGMTPSYIR